MKLFGVAFAAALALASAFSPARRAPRMGSLSMLAAGDVAPDFALKNQNGKVVKLSQFKGKKNVVVFFYPADGTPGCTVEANAFNEALPDFRKANAEVIGISNDEDHSKFIKDYSLKMQLLSDAGGELRKAWGVPKALFGALDGRVTYVINKKGVVEKVYNDLFGADKHVGAAKAALQ